MGRVAVAVIVALWVLPISVMVNRIIPDPYMDEIFHIPQVQRYCSADFKSWDPMITTPPGLYYLSLVHVASLFPGMWCTRTGSSFSGLCSTAVLRSTNCVLAVICSVLIYNIFIHLRPTLGDRRATLFTVVLSLYPIHWFFTFLYYTDVASLTAVLAMYLACLKRRYWLSALDNQRLQIRRTESRRRAAASFWQRTRQLGGLSIFIRQTNVIWMLFVAAIGAINYLALLDGKDDEQVQFPDEKSERLADQKYKPVALNLRKRKLGNSMDTVGVSISEMRVHSSSQDSGLLNEFEELFLRIWCLKWRILVSFFPFLLILAAFLSFVFWNGSVVLGAKDAHRVSPHLAQVFYFGLISAAAMGPIHFSLRQAAALLRVFWKNKPLSLFLVFMCITAGLLSVHFFSIAHPYLLADNRHYPFYIWRKVMKAYWLMKYLLVPVYIYSWLSIIDVLGKVQEKIWVLLFFFACAAVLIPAPLVEFRYYTIPFYFIILHSHVDDNRSWFLMAIFYVTVNIFTMGMFLYRPFHWDHEPGTQRFIW